MTIFLANVVLFIALPEYSNYWEMQPNYWSGVFPISRDRHSGFILC